MSILNVSNVTMDSLEAHLVGELEAVFREHYRMTYRTSYAITGSPEDAEDVVQTIFLRLVRREFPPDLKKNPEAYLYRAAVNQSLDTIRGKKRRVLAGVPPPAEGRHETTESDSAEEIHRRLYEAIAELTPSSAHILVLRYVHDYSDAETRTGLRTGFSDAEESTECFTRPPECF